MTSGGNLNPANAEPGDRTAGVTRRCLTLTASFNHRSGTDRKIRSQVRTQCNRADGSSPHILWRRRTAGQCPVSGQVGSHCPRSPQKKSHISPQVRPRTCRYGGGQACRAAVPPPRSRSGTSYAGGMAAKAEVKIEGIGGVGVSLAAAAMAALGLPKWAWIIVLVVGGVLCIVAVVRYVDRRGHGPKIGR